MNVQNNEGAKQFEIREGGEVAFLTYRIDGDTIELVHTDVPQSLEGRGLGSALARAGFDYARSRGMRVIPVCSFVQRWLDRHPDQRDLAQ